MRVLILDLEISPVKAAIWALRQNGYIPVTNIMGDSEIMSWSAKWHGTDECEYSSLRMVGHTPSGKKRMLKEIHDLMDKADVVVGFNLDAFDIKILNMEFLLAGLAPPAPYKTVDLLKVVRKRFRFTSNKLNYICRKLDIGEKIKHEGIELWFKCMDKHHPEYQESWNKMEEYNVGDVFLTEELYDILKGWIPSPPNRGSYDEACACPSCGSKKFQSRGFAVARSLKYRRFQCVECGSWFRAAKAEPALPVEDRMVAIA